ncbi:hypothetical protein M3Y99_01968200 [Aphelenchoides fujianensis]|nr:hypothetical protein M3Y99_01968200 [Aphelenchoides fujianensis]
MGAVGELEAERQVEAAVKYWTRNLAQVNGLVLPVILNLLLTVGSWVFVYEMRTDSATMPMLLDRASNLTTGSDLYDGMLNGVICVGSVAALSFVMLTFALYDFRRLITAWLSVSCVVLMFCISSTFFSRLLLKLAGKETPIVAAILTAVYGVVGCFAFFTKRLPLGVHQFYVVANCSLVSLFYLQMLPNLTTWFLLGCIVVWGLPFYIFAVLTPIGPLRQVMDKAQDYSEDVLRFLMFTTGSDGEGDEQKAEVHGQEIQEEATHTVVLPGEQEGGEADDSDCSTADEADGQWETDGWEQPEKSEPKKAEVEPPQKTAHDALNDSSARLGMGDFVFYGLLVGKAAASGSVAATLAAAVGVINGLIFTLTVLTDGDETMPALPVSIFCGLVLHFGTLHLVEPMLQVVSFI